MANVVENLLLETSAKRTKNVQGPDNCDETCLLLGELLSGDDSFVLVVDLIDKVCYHYWDN